MSTAGKRAVIALVAATLTASLAVHLYLPYLAPVKKVVPDQAPQTVKITTSMWGEMKQMNHDRATASGQAASAARGGS